MNLAYQLATMHGATVLLAGALVFCGPVWAINKCTGPSGKVTFQDTPCAGQGEELDVKPASGFAPAGPVGVPTPETAKKTTSAAQSPEKREGPYGQTWQRRFWLENTGIPNARRELDSHSVNCEQKQRELEAKKAGANNNLAGATYLQSISAEMQSAATMCSMRSREISERLTKMEQELAALPKAN